MIFLALFAWVTSLATIVVSSLTAAVCWGEGAWVRIVSTFLTLLAVGMFIVVNVMLYQDFPYVP